VNYVLKDLESTEGLDFSKINLNDNLATPDVKDLLQVLCKCLVEVYEYDFKQLEYVEPQIYINLATISQMDEFLVGHEFAVEDYTLLMKVIMV
jgi:hypothetical protein